MLARQASGKRACSRVAHAICPSLLVSACAASKRLCQGAPMYNSQSDRHYVRLCYLREVPSITAKWDTTDHDDSIIFLTTNQA
mmetsp:Transcript_24777/g.68953  ORF Transcript_24777/g.68953 Transcript_24777/m.68953 type:complete len:83 (+) Transcript_24777:585-833(+)